MTKKLLSTIDYVEPTIVEIAVQTEAGFVASDQFEKIEEETPDTEF